MEAGLRGRRGGIRSLLTLLRQHREAVEYDLIALGLRLDDLGSRALTWRDLWVIIRRSPPESAVFRAQNPDSWAWGLPEQLLAAANDSLRVANWQRAGGKRSEYPWPIPRPGVQPQQTSRGREPLPMDAMRKWLGWTD